MQVLSLKNELFQFCIGCLENQLKKGQNLDNPAFRRFYLYQIMEKYPLPEESKKTISECIEAIIQKIAGFKRAEPDDFLGDLQRQLIQFLSPSELDKFLSERGVSEEIIVKQLQKRYPLLVAQKKYSSWRD